MANGRMRRVGDRSEKVFFVTLQVAKIPYAPTPLFFDELYLDFGCP